MKPLPLLAATLFASAGCGPQLTPAPKPYGGYPTVVLTAPVQMQVGSVTMNLPAGTRLVADRLLRGQPAYCGTVLVGEFPERMCFERPGELCLKAERMTAPACFPRGTFRETFT